MCYLELEEDRIKSIDVKTEVHASSSGYGGKSFNKKRKFYKGKRSANQPKKQQTGQKIKRTVKRKLNLARVKCYNCQQKGHFAKSCTAPKKVLSIYSFVSELCVSSSTFLTESHPLWILHSGATGYVTKERDIFVEFRCLPYRAR